MYIILFNNIALSWHPVHEKLFASGGSDGAVLFWLVGLVCVSMAILDL